MMQMVLYTGNGASLTPIAAEGRDTSVYVRLVADDGKVLQNGDTVTQCIDVLAKDVGNWIEIDEPEPEEESTAEEVLNILLGGEA